MFGRGGYSNNQIEALNRCRIAHKLLFLSDMTLASGKFIDSLLLRPPTQESMSQQKSSYIFPISIPSVADWSLWREFWAGATGPAGLLHIPLGEWLHSYHRLWGWFYCEYSDRLFRRQDKMVLSYTRAATHSQTRSRLQYRHEGEYDAIPQHCVPATWH